MLNGEVTALKAGTTTITVTTAEGSFTATCTVTVTATDPTDPDDPDPDDPEWILIDGIKWATRNVDAPGTFAAKPEDLGMFYQWNRKVGWSSTDPMINSNGGNTWSNLFPDATYTWEAANDPCPQGWRVPTHEEQQSLVNSGYSEWTTSNGINGRFFCNGNNKVFFPASGRRNGSTGALSGVGTYGSYWSSTRADVAGAYNIAFTSEAAGTNDPGTTTGYSVRCVKQ